MLLHKAIQTKRQPYFPCNETEHVLVTELTPLRQKKKNQRLNPQFYRMYKLNSSCYVLTGLYGISVITEYYCT